MRGSGSQHYLSSKKSVGFLTTEPNEKLINTVLRYIIVPQRLAQFLEPMTMLFYITKRL